MNDQAVKILIVEDNPEDLKLLRKQLKPPTHPDFDLEHVAHLIAAFKRFEKGGVDLVLLDLFLPQSRGIKTLHKVLTRVQDIPVIALTRFGDEETGLRAVREGAQDYLVKGEIDRNALIRSIRHAIERHRIEKARRKSEDQHRRMAEKLQLANKELEGFTYSVSHDLRAPLRAITGFSEILERRYRPKLDEKGRHYLENIIQAGNQMGMLIDDLLAYSRLGRGSLEAQPIALDEVIAKVVRGLAARITESGGHINVAENLPVITGNATLLTQIFSNLLANALTFHNQDTPPAVTIPWEKTPKFCTVHVADEGIGIPAEQQARIFEVFLRLHSQDDYTGTGIGLAIVKKAIDLHGGQITVDSEADRGAVFHVKLPVKQTNLETHKPGNVEYRTRNIES